MRTERGAAAAAVALTVLLVAGCASEEAASGEQAPASTSTPGGSSAEMADGETSAGDASETEGPGDLTTPPVYDFSATTLDGGTFEGSELAGSPAVLWFWAPWCPTCIGQIPTVTGLAQTYGDDVAVVGVGGLDDAAAISEMAEQDIAGITHLVDEAGEVWQHFGMTQQSTFVVLDADGEVVLEGQVPGTELESVVAGLAG